MTPLRRFLQRLLAFVRFDRAEMDLAREIDAHLQLIEDEHVAGGMSRSEAKLAARRAFGGVEQAKEHQRDARGFRWLDDSRIDFKLGARMLRKYPGLSIIGGAGLAAAIAIGASFFAFFYTFMYSTLPFEDGDRIVALENWDTVKNNEERRAMRDLVAWREGMKSVEEISAFRTIGRNLIIPGGSAEPIRIAQITASAFRITRVPPLFGRLLVEGDERPGAPPVVVIGYDVWQSRFNGDRSVIGREIRIGNIVHTIVGVMPENFAFPVNHSYWTALSTGASTFGPLQGPAIFIFGRLREGITTIQAQAELSTIGRQSAAAFPDTHARLEPRVMPYAHPILDIQGFTGWQFAVMQATVTLLLVLVAINVAILIYARTATRRNEIAVRAALGASRQRIVAQLFIEALVLCAIAATAGIMLAKFGLSQGFAIVATEGAGIPYWIDGSIPAGTIVYVAGVALFASVITGVLPALHATGRRMPSTLKNCGASDRLRLGRTWTALIVAQVALAVAGLPAAVALGWGETRGALTLPVFDKDAFLAAAIAPDSDAPAGMSQQDYARESRQRFVKLQTDLLARLEAEPAVDDVTIADAVPNHEPDAHIEIEGQPALIAGAPTVGVNRVGVDFFPMFDARIVAGRALQSTDATGPPVGIVNRAFVRQLLQDNGAIGRRVKYTDGINKGNTFEIVGVVSDLQANPADPSLVAPVVFQLRPATSASATLLIRVRGSQPALFTQRLRDMLARMDPSVRMSAFAFADFERQQVLAFRLMVLAISSIVITVLLLSAAGIYALMSFTVSQRRKEIGIRAALGADARQLLVSIFAKAAAQLGAGVMVGASIAALVDVASGGDVLGSFGRALLPITSAIMIIVGLIAAIGPARRGLRVQPTEALRAE
jgi:predicted permease